MVLTGAIEVIQFVSSQVIRRFFSFPGTPEFQWYNPTLAIVNLLLNPVVLFVIYYELGSTVQRTAWADQIGIVTYSFVGGSIGFLVGSAFTLLITNLFIGSFSFGEGSFSFFAIDILLAVIRVGASVAFVAFTGITLGRIKSK